MRRRTEASGSHRDPGGSGAVCERGEPCRTDGLAGGKKAARDHSQSLRGDDEKSESQGRGGAIRKRGSRNKRTLANRVPPSWDEGARARLRGGVEAADSGVLR